MIRNETFLNGICIEADIYDLDTRIYQREETGVIVATRPMSDDEIRLWGPQSLNQIGSLAALLVVQGAVSIEDAANALQITPQDLVNEAQGWAAAKGLNHG